jgi:hypothetical protein
MMSSRARAGESLNQLLQDQAGGDDGLTAREGGAQGIDLRGGDRLITPEREGPDARIDKQRRRRERSAL